MTEATLSPEILKALKLKAVELANQYCAANYVRQQGEKAIFSELRAAAAVAVEGMTDELMKTQTELGHAEADIKELQAELATLRKGPEFEKVTVEEAREVWRAWDRKDSVINGLQDMAAVIDKLMPTKA